MDPHAPRRVLDFAAVLAWSTAILPVAVGCLRSRTCSGMEALTLGAGVSFLAAFLVGRGLRERRALLGVGAVEATAAVLAASAIGFGLTPVLLVIVAAQAPRVLRPRVAVGLVLAQTGLWALLSLWLRPGEPLWVLVGAYAGFQLFALSSRAAEEREAVARRELARAHAELAVAQSEREEAMRTRERLRIARELHDSVGHQLTVLHLNLELIANTEGAPHADAVQRSQGLLRDVLSDVRAVVSGMRSAAPFDLGAALRSLGSGVRTPRVHVRADDAGQLTDAALAHCLFRCAQEGLTNALRHSDAKEIEVALVHGDRRWGVSVRNDGSARAEAPEGNGLLGARERARELGGTLESGPLPEGGWELRAELPEEVG